MKIRPVLAAALVLLGVFLGAQTIENRRPTWADYKGTPVANSPYEAFTYWSVHYSYDAPEVTPKGFQIRFRIWNRLDDPSWVKPNTLPAERSAELLNHEQGHYTLSVLCALEFKKAVSGRLFGNQYHTEIGQIFDQVLGKYLDMEKRYDAETRHGRDSSQQKVWDAKLAQRVNELWVYR